MASWAETEGLEGVSNWMYVQADEERVHMLKLIHYVNERGGKGIIPAFEQPPVAYSDVKSMFEKVLTHEEYISASINEIVAVCVAEKDFTTQNFIQWFVNEQIQEEKSARTILDKLRILGVGNMYIFDRDIMGLRAAEAPAGTVA
jgi:ferritin